MSDSAKCPRCQAELPANFPPGVCPACLMQQGLGNSTFMGSVDSAGSGTRSRSGRRHRWTPPTPEELAPRFPQLEIAELLGQGGMGAVYKVRQRDLDRWAALKILPDDVADDPNFSERFQREARALALLGHQHIVIVYEFGQRDGVYFLLMEYIDGVTLRQAIRAGQITARDALGIVTQICDALQFAHEEGVVHRDIKPENILIDKRGRVKIADFGLAKMLSNGSVEVPTLTGTHQVMGTPMYMAPEQMEGTRGVDHRADIFSLGVVFYELLTGELPLGRFAPPSQKYRLDVRLDEVVLRTLEKEPDRRYQQASDVKCDIESIRSQPPGPPGKVVRPKTEGRSTLAKRIATMALMGLLCGLFFIIGLGINWMRAQQELVRAQESAMRERALLSQLQAAQQQKSQLQASLAQQQSGTSLQEPARTEPEDLYEAASIVQFTTDGPILNPRFGTQELTLPQRETVNRILKKVHAEYLAVEAEKTLREDQSPADQVIVISNIPEEQIARLKNELWTSIDTELPRDHQRFLRKNLPLFADNNSPPLLLDSNNMPVLPYYPAGGMGGMGMGSMMMGSGGGYMPGMGMGAGGGGMGFPTSNNQILRYPQLLGWKAQHLPLRIMLGRKGKWFDWSIHATSGEAQYLADSGEAPELPTGLRRFWKNASVSSPAEHREPPEMGSVEPPPFADEQLPLEASPTISPADSFPPDDLTIPPNDVDLSAPIGNQAPPAPVNMIVFDEDQPKLGPNFGGDAFTDEDRKFIDDILARIHRAFLEVERRNTRWETREDGSQVSVISEFQEKVEKLENDLWTAVDQKLAIEKQKKLRTSLRFFGYLPAPGNGWGGPSPAHSLHLLGWDQSPGPDSDFRPFPIRITIRRQGQWYHWTMYDNGSTSNNGTTNFRRISTGVEPELPAGIRRFWRTESGAPSETKTSVADSPSDPATAADGDSTSNEKPDESPNETSESPPNGGEPEPSSAPPQSIQESIPSVDKAVPQ